MMVFSCAHVRRAVAWHARRMKLRRPSRRRRRDLPAFDAQAFLDSSRVARTIVRYGRGETIFTQGDVCDDVLYIRTGGVKLSVVSKRGREAGGGTLGPGDFFGGGGLPERPGRR